MVFWDKIKKCFGNDILRPWRSKCHLHGLKQGFQVHTSFETTVWFDSIQAVLASLSKHVTLFMVKNCTEHMTSMYIYLLQ